jgi:hypothetical protein
MPHPGSLTNIEEQTLMKSLWTEEDDIPLATLKKELVDGPCLKGPNFTRLFYLKTDWSRIGMGAAICQADAADKDTVIDDVKKTLVLESPFDLTRSGMRLRPCSMIPCRNTKPEQLYHSFIGEAGAGRWAMGKYQSWLIGQEFVWLSDGGGLTMFFESDKFHSNPVHMVNCLHAELLQYHFRIEHRPVHMMRECHLLWRYINFTKDWRLPLGTKANCNADVMFYTQDDEELDRLSRVIPRHNNWPICSLPPVFVGSPKFHQSGPAVATVNPERVVVAIDATDTPIEEALSAIGINHPLIHVSTNTQHEDKRVSIHDFSDLVLNGDDNALAHVDWLFATYPGE